MSTLHAKAKQVKRFIIAELISVGNAILSALLLGRAIHAESGILILSIIYLILSILATRWIIFEKNQLIDEVSKPHTSKFETDQ